MGESSNRDCVNQNQLLMLGPQSIVAGSVVGEKMQSVFFPEEFDLSDYFVIIFCRNDVSRSCVYGGLVDLNFFGGENV